MAKIWLSNPEPRYISDLRLWRLAVIVFFNVSVNQLEDIRWRNDLMIVENIVSLSVFMSCLKPIDNMLFFSARFTSLFTSTSFDIINLSIKGKEMLDK